ncbi:MAG TPA: STAS domain-containing protein [Spirochaetota bacterium]|nr:STAS domain-containing protein [Spirochaetota bacterium]HPR47780.1 STAS domain-containing protein [Spirochaetota bacterium]
METMEIVIKKIGNVVVFYPSGKLGTLFSVEKDRKIINSILDLPLKDYTYKESSLLINMKEVLFLSSESLNYLISFSKRKIETSNEKIKICCLHDEVKNLFEVTNVADLLEIFKTEEDALWSINENLD